MLLAMCADAGMLIGVMVCLMILSVVALGLIVLAVVGVVKFIDALRRSPGVAYPASPESIP